MLDTHHRSTVINRFTAKIVVGVNWKVNRKVVQIHFFKIEKRLFSNIIITKSNLLNFHTNIPNIYNLIHLSKQLIWILFSIWYIQKSLNSGFRYIRTKSDIIEIPIRLIGNTFGISMYHILSRACPNSSEFSRLDPSSKRW